MSFINLESDPILIGNYSQIFGLGFEVEMIERAAKAQVIKYLPELTGKLQNIWDQRDIEYEEFLGESKEKLIIPTVEKQNIRSGLENISLIEAPIQAWPTVLIYVYNGTAYGIQEDQFDTENLILRLEILCSSGPVKEESIHGVEGLEKMEELNRQLQRLTDAVYLCIQKDKTLSGTVGQFEKPPKFATAPPWSRKQDKTATGESFIKQAKQLEWSVQKITC